MKKLILLSTMGLFLAINLFGQPAREVISINSGKDLSMLRSALPVPEGAVQSRAFDYNPRLRQLTAANVGDTLMLDFFDNRQYKAVVTRVSRNYDGVLGITSNIVDADFAACFISISEAGISIRADLPAKNEQYMAVGTDKKTVLSQYSLSEVRKKSYKPDTVRPSPVPEVPDDSAQNKPVQTRAATDDIEAPVTIDVLIVYTAKAKQWADKNVTSIDNAIDMAFQYANYLLSNSLTNITLNMVYKHETDYAYGDDNGGDMLEPLANKNDGILDEVHDLRRQYKADLVALMPLSGGVGFLPRSDILTNPASSGDFGFCVSDVEGSAYSTTLIHEIGHNMGTGHHWQQRDGPGPGVFSYSSAWRGVGTDEKWYFTVQSYAGDQFPDKNPSTLIPYFSNPDVIVHGVRIGSIDKENNALTLKQTKHPISRYSELIGGQDPFEVNSDGVLTRYNGQGGHVAIPVSLGVKTIGASSFREVLNLQAIIIPESVTSIENRAFENCTAMTKATLPASLTRIEASAFGNCTKLNQVFINAQTPPSVAADVFSTISSCNLIVPKGKKGAYAAASVWKDFGVITEVHALSDFVIENKVLKKYVGTAYDVTIPSEVIAIGDSAFYGQKITSVTIGENVTSIGSYAFARCRDLQFKFISIPNSVTYIGDAAFDLVGVQEINVEAGNPAYSSADGVLFNKDKTMLLQYPMEKPETSYVIPDGVQTVSVHAFHANYNLQSINIPASVINIGGGITFESCQRLKSIKVDDANASYASVDDMLLSKDKTELIRYPEGKTGKAILPNSITTIGWYCFWNCEKLDSVIIPSSVKIIEMDFGNFKDLDYMEVHWIKPLEVPDNLFGSVNLDNATLSVPHGTKALYQVAPTWKKFGKIVEREVSTGTEEIDVAIKVSLRDHTLYICSPTAETVEVYSFTGTKLFTARKDAGEAAFTVPTNLKAVIIRGSSGWTRKTIDN